MLLSYSLLIVPFTLMLGSLLWLTYLASVKPRDFALIILLYLGTNAFLQMVSNFKPGFQFGGISVYPFDMFTFAAIFSNKSRGEKSPHQLNSRELVRVKFLISALALGAILGAIMWTVIGGLEFGVNSWREYLLTLAVMYYFLNKNFSWTVEHLKVILILPGALLAVAVAIRFVFFGIGSSTEINTLTGARYINRAASSEGALLILLAGIGSFYLLKDRVFLRSLILITSGVEVVLLQHRTVWISSLAFVIGILFSKGLKDKQTFLKIGYLYLIVIFGFSLWFISREIHTLTESSQNTGTLNWRTKRWLDSLSVTRSFTDWIFGSVFGPNSVTQNFQITSHSEFITKIEYLGIVGLILTLLMFLVLLRYRGSKENLNILQKIIVGTAFLYSVTYSTPLSFFVLAPVIFKINLRSGSVATQSFSKLNKVNHVTEW